MFSRSLRICAGAVFGVALAGAASAQFNSGAAQVASRIPSFLLKPLPAPASAAILFKPGDPTSTAEAATIERVLAAAGGWAARRVPIDQAGAARASVAFVPRGLAGDYGRVEQLTRAGVLTIGSDPACVRAARCVAAVASGGRIEILVSRAARAASGLKFKSTFLMLVKEV